MRRIVAVLTIVSLLLVSSLPALVEAADCASPEQARANLHSNHRLTRPTPRIFHEHAASFADDYQHACIECGCGCHRSIDALPHLLAPCACMSPDAISDIASLEAGYASESFRLPVVLAIPIPPPQSI